MRVMLIPIGPCPEPTPVVLENFPVIVTHRLLEAEASDRRPAIHENHCRIVALGGLVRVCDLGSRHGTLANGRPIRRAWLWPGDSLTIGLRSFRVAYDLGEPCRENLRKMGCVGGCESLGCDDGAEYVANLQRFVSVN